MPIDKKPLSPATDKELVRVTLALAHPVRLAILRLLADRKRRLSGEITAAPAAHHGLRPPSGLALKRAAGRGSGGADDELLAQPESGTHRPEAPLLFLHRPGPMPGLRGWGRLRLFCGRGAASFQNLKHVRQRFSPTFARFQPSLFAA